MDNIWLTSESLLSYKLTPVLEASLMACGQSGPRCCLKSAYDEPASKANTYCVSPIPAWMLSRESTISSKGAIVNLPIAAATQRWLTSSGVGEAALLTASSDP